MSYKLKVFLVIAIFIGFLGATYVGLNFISYRLSGWDESEAKQKVVEDIFGKIELFGFSE